ncbi:MAG: (d)CMP kinase [Syntrophomonadaceae bacterium]|nr:(d)CMP kinase [Syntrophomonadaceae bacterium]
MQIAIDGPAGAGKSTLARTLARKMGFVYIDTGAMYRALAWKVLQTGISLEDAEAIAKLALGLDIHFENYRGEQRLLCNGEDLTEMIRSPQVNAAVSRVAQHPEVRRIMVQKQQDMARSSNVVMDGRDIGEWVLPEADYKFYLTAGLQERALRRKMELENKGFRQDLETIMEELRQRDQMDQSRQVGALKILPDSIVIDSSRQSADEVLQQILTIVGKN